MPFGSLPTSGGGLRCWQMYQGLKSRGYEVVASMPSFTYLTKKYFDQIPEDVRENLWEWHTQDEIYKRVKPDIVLYSSNWDHYNLSQKPDVPLVIDLHGSRLIETSLWGETPDIQKKLSVFSKADCLLTAGQKQKMYFYGWLLQSGRIPDNEHFIRYIPISLSPDVFTRNASEDAFPYFVSGGGWFPWQDQSRAVFEICNQIKRRQSGLFNIFGTPHENANPSQDELKIRKIYSQVKNIADESPHINVIGYVGRDELLKEYARAHIAVELMNYNLERELAFTTRTIEYLWCGLPVIYNDYSEISKHISEYDAGWAIDPNNGGSLSEVVEEIYTQPERVRIKSQNAQRLVQDRFSWNKTIEPLVLFIENPILRKESRPVKGFSSSSSSYLTPQSKEASLQIDADTDLIQEFVFPTESIWALQINTFCSENANVSVRSDCSIKNSIGLTIASRSFDLQPGQNNLFIKIPVFLRPSGGSKGVLRIRFSGSLSESPVSIKVNATPIYPLESLRVDSIKKIESRDPLGREIVPHSCCISFFDGAGRMYHYKSKLKKGLWVLQQGDIKRIIRAILKRSPRLHPLFRHFF